MKFLEKFEDLATLNNIQNDHKLHAFKISMPKEVELHLNNINNLQDCYQTAKDLLTIVHEFSYKQNVHTVFSPIEVTLPTT